MRGKRWVAFDSDGPHGLIPACAGKTHPRSIAGMDIRAHPRACGENSALPWLVGLLGGSSPRMRGKPVTEQATEGATRLIPAHAGKTTYRNGQTSGVRAHPRACGENPVKMQSCSAGLGSSPRMRGKRGESGKSLESRRLIPAHAGKTKV